jgi:phage terminase large subunit
MAEVEFPDALRFLFEPARYKVAYGGRGSGKSWGFARALLLLASMRRMRVLCAREVQKSIKDSVHKLLSDQIESMGLAQKFRVLETEIRGVNGSEVLFSGLSSQTAANIKSFEGVDVAWVEEAQTVSKKSWDLLVPTIRKPGSEIWVSFNPGLDDDDTWTRFVLNPPPGAKVVKVNYSDNPWFPAELETERQHCYLTDRESYDNIWEGKTKSAVDGAIYAKEIEQATLERRIRPVPYDPMLKVHPVFDLGWNDAMTVGFYQRVASELRVIDYIEDSHKTLDWYAEEIRARRYNLGGIWLPHDGFHRDFKTGKSAAEIMEALGFEVNAIPNVPVHEGIGVARLTFRQAFFDETRAARLVLCLKRYRRHVNVRTLEPGAPVHDEYSHGADNWRYACLVADQMTNAAKPAVFKRRGGAMAV